jgi:hypothetical protein
VGRSAERRGASRAPLDRRRQAGGAGERYFVGRREGRRVFVVSRQDVAALPHHGRLGDTPFDWARSGEGAYELAYSLLAEVTGARPSASVCGLLEVEVLARLPWEGFVVLASDLDYWLALSVSDAERAAWPALPREPDERRNQARGARRRRPDWP